MIEEIIKRFMVDGVFYGQKMLILMYLVKFLMRYVSH